MLCYAAKFRPMISNPRWFTTLDDIQRVAVAIVERRFTLSVLATPVIFLTLFVHHTLFVGWMMFMPHWQLQGKARTGWEMCWAWRGGCNIYYIVRQNPYIWLSMLLLLWHQDVGDAVMHPIVYLTKLTLRKYLVVGGSHGAQHSKYLTSWLL